MNPVLSIVIPAYNLERHIEQCVRSVLVQLRRHHELIVIDDGSTDQTLALVEKLRQAWPDQNFHVLSQANEGIAGVRNRGVRAAGGDYIAWLDGDDVMLCGVLEMLDQAIARQRPDVIACDFNVWHPQEPAKTHRSGFGYPANVLVHDADAILNSFLAARKNYLWAHVIRRDIYKQLPEPVFPPGRVFEDVSTLPRLLSLCARLLYLPAPIIDYRQHPGSITQSITEKWCMDFAAALTVARDQLHARGVSDSVRRHFDIAAGHFYIAVVKSSYHLPRAAGKRVRSHIRPSFANDLFGDCDSMLASTRRQDTLSTNLESDLKMIRQVRLALSGSLLFHVGQSLSRKFKSWRHARRLRRYEAAPARLRYSAR